MMPPGPPEGDDNNRNTIIAIILCVAILFGWEYFFSGPQRVEMQKARQTELARVEAAAAKPAAVPAAPGEATTDAAAPSAPAPRIVFDNPSAIDGTINLEGARFDDLHMKRHFETVERTAEARLFAPLGAEHHYDAVLGWETAGEDKGSGVGQRALWTAPAGARLTPDTPLVLTHEADGLRVTRTVTLDQDYMFTITDVVENTGAAPRTLRPYGVIRRTGLPDDFMPNQIVHQGMLGVFGPEPILHDITYQRGQKHAREKAEGKKLEDARLFEGRGPGGWLGISDHYWLAAMIPPQAEEIEGWYDARQEGADAKTISFRSAYRGAPRTIAPGATIEYQQKLYAGAKTVDILQRYQKELAIPNFDKAVDWGNFWFLTRPFFWLLDFFGGLLGNFGLAIMATTVAVKLLLFPLVNQSFEAMSKLKKLQPKMKEVQEKYANDKQRQQQEMLKLYQTEKVNPVAGCLPILVQIPIFYALYKVLTVTIEMRHAPFFGWIQDLSAKDPTNIFNLFGLIPFDPGLITPFLHVGIWPILYGITMWGVTALNPQAPDPIQRQVFALLPFVFVFLFGGFAAGLVIYWTWSNLLSILQQYVIMRKNGVETEFDKLLARFNKAPAGTA